MVALIGTASQLYWLPLLDNISLKRTIDLENIFTDCCVFVMQKGLTALMYAVQHEHVRVVKELLLAGADGTARDRVRLVWSNECETVWWHVSHVHQSMNGA